jgi:hypothetical protein
MMVEPSLSYIGPGGNVDVPISLDGILVTNLGNALFEYSQTLTSISIPDRRYQHRELCI